MISRNKSFLKTKLPLILASKSEIRKKMLEGLGLDFKIVSSKIDEEIVELNIPTGIPLVYEKNKRSFLKRIGQVHIAMSRKN